MRFRLLALLSLATFLGAPAAFAGEKTLKADPAAELKKKIREKTRYKPAPFTMTVADPVSVGGGVYKERLSYPSPYKGTVAGRNDTVRADLYRTEDPEKSLLIVLGGWMMDPYTPQLARRLARTGIQTVFVQLPYQDDRTPRGKRSGELTVSADLEETKRVFFQLAQDVGRVRHWMVQKRKVNPKRVGVLGTSLGGFASSVLYGMTGDYNCAVVQLAGADLAPVLMGGHWVTARLRIQLIRKGIDQKQVRSILRPFAPSTWARPEAKEGLLLVAAERDRLVPLSSVRKLARLYGGADLAIIPGATHIAIDKYAEVYPRVYDHVIERLLPEATPAKKKKGEG